MITHLSTRIKNVVKEINPNQNKIDVIALIALLRPAEAAPNAVTLLTPLFVTYL